MYADNLSLFFSFLSLRLCLCLRRPGLDVRRNDASTSTSTREWKPFQSLVLVLNCLRRYVLRVNRDDASINTSASTRRLCLRRTGLHVGFLCLCLRRTCKPGLNTNPLTYAPMTGLRFAVDPAFHIPHYIL